MNAHCQSRGLPIADAVGDVSPADLQALVDVATHSLWRE